MSSYDTSPSRSASSADTPVDGAAAMLASGGAPFDHSSTDSNPTPRPPDPDAGTKPAGPGPSAALQCHPVPAAAGDGQPAAGDNESYMRAVTLLEAVSAENTRRFAADLFDEPSPFHSVEEPALSLPDYVRSLVHNLEAAAVRAMSSSSEWSPTMQPAAATPLNTSSTTHSDAADAHPAATGHRRTRLLRRGVDIAVVLLARFSQRTGLLPTLLTRHRLFAAAYLAALRSFNTPQDTFGSLAAYAYFAGLYTPEMARLDAAFMRPLAPAAAGAHTHGTDSPSPLRVTRQDLKQLREMPHAALHGLTGTAGPFSILEHEGRDSSTASLSATSTTSAGTAPGTHPAPPPL